MQNDNNLAIYCENEEYKNYPLDKVADLAYKKLGQTAPLAIEIVFVSEDEIRNLNAEQRQIDKVTDVLSFPYLDGIRYKKLTLDGHGGETDENGRLLIGSVCICEKRAKEQATEYGHSLMREVCYLALHGVLHCFGYDHMTESDEAEMTTLAKNIMDELNIGRDL